MSERFHNSMGRVFDIAIVDVVLTVAAAGLISQAFKPFNNHTGEVIVASFIIGEVAHSMFTHLKN